ncbi:hypothetical protein RZS08_42145, partial [Arthrospira platensis SPKY1]|nr:hypothetical protein [Arthrospira platensis SPKY1]
MAVATSYAISGTVLSGGSPLEGVSISGGGLGIQITDASGNYSFVDVPHGAVYTLTPSRAGYVFSPLSATGTCTSNRSHDFVGTLNIYTLQGKVSWSGSGLAGVSVNGGALGTRVT